MRLTIVAAWSGVAAIAVGLWALPAAAEPKQRGTALSQSEVSVSSQSRARRARTVHTRTRITVRPRSYLDGGTEVLPGERKFTDYAIGPTAFTSSASDQTAFWRRSPLPGPFDLPGKNNPFQW